MNKEKEIPEAKSLRWLANMFPLIENPQNEEDKMCNAIHVYCTVGANKIEELSELNEKLHEKIAELDLTYVRSEDNSIKHNYDYLIGKSITTKYKDLIKESEKIASITVFDEDTFGQGKYAVITESGKYIYECEIEEIKE